MINENQYKILLNPKVQELIKALDLEVRDTGSETRRLISNRIEGWLDKIEFKPRVISMPQVDGPFSDKDTWIRDQISIHGRQWCPF